MLSHALIFLEKSSNQTSVPIHRTVCGDQSAGCCASAALSFRRTHALPTNAWNEFSRQMVRPNRRSTRNSWSPGTWTRSLLTASDWIRGTSLLLANILHRPVSSASRVCCCLSTTGPSNSEKERRRLKDQPVARRSQPACPNVHRATASQASSGCGHE